VTALEEIAVGAATDAVTTSAQAPHDRPRARRRLGPGAVGEAAVAAAASAAIVLVAFQFAGSQPIGGMIVCFALGFGVSYGIVSRVRHGARIAKDRLATIVIWVGALVALFPLLEIIINVITQGAPVVFGHFPAFLVHDESTAGLTAPIWKGGMGHAIVGTIEQVGLATIYTVPISMLTAVYLSESTSPFSRLVRTVVDSMMGTPSIIAGIFVYLFWVQPRGSSGFSGFAASIALAILMLPVMIRTAEEVIRVVPGSLREAALALGSPRWRVSLRVVLPTVRAGLLTATILGVALAVGETAPTLFTAHGSTSYNFNPFSGSQANLPLQAFQDILSPNNTLVRSGWGGAFILVFMVLSLFVLARFVSNSKPGRLRRLLRLKQKEVVVS
jgi:phosphate transport system permease protein